jgi:hypothetical protein
MTLEIDGKVIYFPRALNEIFGAWVEEVEFDGEMSYDEEEGIFTVSHSSFPIDGNDFEVIVQLNEPTAVFAVAARLHQPFSELSDHKILEFLNSTNAGLYCGHFEKVGKHVRFKHSIDVENGLLTGELLSNMIRAAMAACSADFVAELKRQ